MTLLIDPPLLVGAGAAVHRFVGDERRARQLDLLALAGFLGLGVGMYVNAPWLRWSWGPLGAESGRDFMINSRVFSFPHRRPHPSAHAVALAVFATYPVWQAAGARVGRRWRERAR